MNFFGIKKSNDAGEVRITKGEADNSKVVSIKPGTSEHDKLRDELGEFGIELGDKVDYSNADKIFDAPSDKSK